MHLVTEPDHDPYDVDSGYDKPNPPSPRDLIAQQIILELLDDEVGCLDVWTRPGLSTMPRDVIEYIAATANEMREKLIDHLKSQL